MPLLPLSSALLLTLMATSVLAAVSADEAALLSTTLTPMGAERAGNAEGTIPPWNGGYAVADKTAAGARRGDPFADEKPILSITAKNMDRYAARLSDGTKALLAKYPDFRVDVYPTHRTAAAPQWVYDNTRANATRARMVDSSAGPIPERAFGGVPFPIPRSGVEVMWNHLLRWRASSWSYDNRWYLNTADGRHVLVSESVGNLQMPYYFQEGSADKFNGDYWLLRGIYSGPPIRNGEGLVARLNLNDDKSQLWVYLAGQRRVRKLPNPCCDTPAPASAGVMAIDEVDVFTGRTERFDWKLLGKKELYIRYNVNRLFRTSDSAAMAPHHMNPDAMRWELHRVWAVEATLRQGERHQAHRSVYYLDEDTWTAVLADRWDAKGQLWRTLWSAPVVVPELPATIALTFGYYDLLTNTWFAASLVEHAADQSIVHARFPDAFFTPEALAGEGIR
jgi:hypothetical protein